LSSKKWITRNPQGSHRVIVTKQLPGEHWIEILEKADCRIDICTAKDALTVNEIKSSMGDRCEGAIGQLTEAWGEELFAALKKAGGKVYSNYAVGFDNVDVAAATEHGIPVGNTPGVLTEATAEMAVALTFAAARRVVEADRYVREGRFQGWLPDLFLGELLWRKTLGVIGLGRIGSAYAGMMVEGHKMNLIYYSRHRKRTFEDTIGSFGEYLNAKGEEPVTCKRAGSVEEVLREADVVSLHTVLNPATRHLINAERLALMKKHAILVNTGRGPLIDESALADHCRNHPDFSAALDVFENEPAIEPGLRELNNVIVLPHIASATNWTREGMASLAAANVAAVLQGYPVWSNTDILPFLEKEPPGAAPSILNAKELGLSFYQ